MPKENVVIVGGGGAGVPTANLLSAKLDSTKYNLILINKRPYYVHLVAGIRMVVSGQEPLEDRALMPFEQNFVNGNGKLMVGTVVSINESKMGQGGQVVLEDGQTVDYCVLVVCPGSNWEGPLNFPNNKAENKEWIHKWRSRFAEVDDIVLAGGGAVGVEFAGEIKELYPNKRVTIIHRDNALLNPVYPLRWRNDILRRIQERGVKVVFNEFIDDFNIHDGEIRTRSGKTFPADLLVPTCGPRPNTTLFTTFDGDSLTPQGFVKVKPTLQVVNHPHIFAAGDVINWNEQKQIGKYGNHAAVVAANIITLLNGGEPTKVYKGSYELIVVTIGKTRGASYFGILWGITFGNWFSAMAKSKTLLISNFRARMGLKD